MMHGHQDFVSCKRKRKPFVIRCMIFTHVHMKTY